MKNLLSLTLVFLLFSCGEKSMQPVNEKIMDLASDRSDSFRSMEGKVTLKVLKIEDSRCPSDVICIWGGVAAVSFEVKSGGHTATGKVYYPEYPENLSQAEVKLGNQKFRVTLKDVTPYPCQSCTGQPESKAQLEVETI